jgi:hypothetical protein
MLLEYSINRSDSFNTAITVANPANPSANKDADSVGKSNQKMITTIQNHSENVSKIARVAKNISDHVMIVSNTENVTAKSHYYC